MYIKRILHSRYCCDQCLHRRDNNWDPSSKDHNNQDFNNHVSNNQDFNYLQLNNWDHKNKTNKHDPDHDNQDHSALEHDNRLECNSPDLLLIEMESAYSYSASLPRTHATPSLWVAVDRNGICIFLLWVAFPKRALHQVYELLLIEMELIHRNLNIPDKESYSQI